MSILQHHVPRLQLHVSRHQPHVPRLQNNVYQLRPCASQVQLDFAGSFNLLPSRGAEQTFDVLQPLHGQLLQACIHACTHACMHSNCKHAHINDWVQAHMHRHVHLGCSPMPPGCNPKYPGALDGGRGRLSDAARLPVHDGHALARGALPFAARRVARAGGVERAAVARWRHTCKANRRCVCPCSRPYDRPPLQKPTAGSGLPSGTGRAAHACQCPRNFAAALWYLPTIPLPRTI